MPDYRTGLNNPINPLSEVATLDIDQRNLGNGKIAVVASLKFKKGFDLQGMATTQAGQQIAVIYSLALRSAVLDLYFQWDDPRRRGETQSFKRRARYIISLEYRGSSQELDQERSERSCRTRC